MTAGPPATSSLVVYADDVQASIARLNTLAGTSQVRYTTLLWRVDPTGTVLEDLTPCVQRDDTSPAAVTHDSTADICGKLAIPLQKQLQWGYDLVQPVLCAWSPEALEPGGAWSAWPCGIFVATTPGADSLDKQAGRFAVTGWDRTYLLQPDPQRSFVFPLGYRYAWACRDVFRAAGIIDPSTGNLSDVCTYSSDFYAKTLPAARSYPAGAGMSCLQIVNELLAASGQRPVYCDPGSGGFVIEDVPKPAEQSTLWDWQGSQLDVPLLPGADFPARKIIRYDSQQYTVDLFSAPNRWVFVQSGLAFTPSGTDGSTGRYVVDNTSTQPADQTTIGRVVPKVVSLDASGPLDLIKQGDAIVAADLAAVERLAFSTCPWPAAGHYDVFRYANRALLGPPLRRLQAQAWTLPLDGRDMTWQANAVGLT